jgi:DNA-binding response OmpR family regulator
MKHEAQTVSTGAKLLVVDDEHAARRSLVNLLQRTGYQTTEAASGQEALDCLKRQPFDLVILDLKMPDMDGTLVLKQARPLVPETVFIILTAFGTLDSAVTALRHDAFDYLLKPSPLQEIVRAVEAGLAERRKKSAPDNPVALLEQALTSLKTAPQAPVSTPAAERFLQAPDLTVDTQRRLVVVRNRPVELTSTEFDILVYLLQHRDRIVSSRELASHLRGCDMDERDARLLLRSHIHRLRQKLELDPSNPSLICTARGNGFYIPD